MKKIIGQEDYHDGMTRVVYEDLSVDVTSQKVSKDVPDMWDVVEVIDSKGLVETGNIMKSEKSPKYVALMTVDTLGVFDFVSIKGDLLTVSQDGEELVFKKADVIEVVFTDSYKDANIQAEGMSEETGNIMLKETKGK